MSKKEGRQVGTQSHGDYKGTDGPIQGQEEEGHP